MSEFDAWIGREQVAKDILDPALAARWLATFDLATPQPPIMPQGIHFALCTPEAPTGALGEDGHPAREDHADSFLPPFDMPRRMWASSAITFIAPIAIGAAIERTSRVASIAEKDGASGKLAFVNVEHETRSNGTLSIREIQTLVYREAASADAALSPPAPGDGEFNAAEWDRVRTITPDPRLLQRFSALTFNTHRIHYDAPYARDVERYRGLVVHGPLMASLLLQFMAQEVGDNRLRSFTFRAISPAIANEELNLCLGKDDNGYELGAFAKDGRQVMKASGAV